MQLVKEPGVKLKFRKEDFDVTYHYYLCEDTGERYTTDELDRINETQVHNKYREKYGIPFPDEIREVREQYGISASKMAEVLGFGTNSYRLYESGEIPSVANGRLILAIKHPKDFIKQIEASSHLLTDKERNKFIATATELIERHRREVWDFLFSKKIFNNESANEYSGYRKPDAHKIANIISFFSAKIDYLFKTKLNKLLFYADFGSFKQTGYSMTGISYRAIQMGPVPAEYNLLYEKLCEDNLVSNTQILFNDGNYGEAITGTVGFDEELFTKTEIEVLETVVGKMGKLNTQKVVNLSHEETAWIENNEDKVLISYPKYAFDLKNL